MVFVVSQLPLSSEISQLCSSGACPSPLLLPGKRESHVRSYVETRFRILNLSQLGEVQNHTWSALTDSSCLLIKSIIIVYRIMIIRCRALAGFPLHGLRFRCCSPVAEETWRGIEVLQILNLAGFREAKKHTRSGLGDFLPVVDENYHYYLPNHAH